MEKEIEALRREVAELKGLVHALLAMQRPNQPEAPKLPPIPRSPSLGPNIPYPKDFPIIS